MSNIIYFTENKTKGVQVSAELLDMLQTTEKTLEQAFVCMMGNNGIVCGCNNLGGGIYAEGLIIWNNELFVFKGGPLGAYIIVDSVTTQCTFCSGDVERIWTVKTAKFAASIPDDGTGIAVTADLPEFYHPEYTFFTLDAQVVENTTDIANIEGDIVDIQGDITDIQTDITDIQNTDTNQQSQIDYLNSQLQVALSQITILSTRINDCCEPAPALDIDFTGSTMDICFQDSTPGKLFGQLHLVASGTNFGSLNGTVSSAIHISDAPGVKDKFVTFSPAKTGANPSFDIQLLLGMGNTIDTAVGGNTRTISFTVRVLDDSSFLHFVTVTANIPQLANTDCSNGVATTFILEEI